MKKIINGKKYDTDTATLIASWDNGLGYNDFSFCKENLYRKKTGEYFIHGEGGALSKYSKSVEMNTRVGGESITPLTEEEAKTWVEQHANESYEEIFGEVEE